MTRTRILVAAVAAAFSACYAGAATSAGSMEKGGAARSAPSAKHESFSRLDTDNDGFIGRIEAAADADAKSNFEKLDKNKDSKLSRSEY